MESIFSGREPLWFDDSVKKSHYIKGNKACRGLSAQVHLPVLLWFSRTALRGSLLYHSTSCKYNVVEYMLNEFSLHEPDIYKIIFLDRAGYHKAKALKVPQNIKLVYLPSSNPELNPVERFWQDMKEKVAFKNFKDEEELELWIEQTANAYSKDEIASITGYAFIKNAVKFNLNIIKQGL